MQIHGKKAVNLLIDYDGTIMDSAERGLKCVNHVLQHYNVEPLTLEQYHEEFTQPFIDFYRKFIPGITEEEERKVYENAAMENPPKLRPNVISVLRKLKENGYKLAVVSCNGQEEIDYFLGQYGMKDLFFDIKGSISNKALEIGDFLKKHSLDPETTVYIGDTDHDITSSRANNLRVIAMKGGISADHILEELEPDMIVSCFDELLKIF